MGSENNEPPKGTVITGFADVSFASLAEETQRPVWFLECECFDTFKLFSKEREDFNPDEIPARLNRALDILNRQDVVFSIFVPIDADMAKGMQAAGLQPEFLKAFAGADMKSENFYLYRIRRVH